MLLAVDVGNTHTVYGVFDGETSLASWRVATRADTTGDELGVLLRRLFADAGLKLSDVDGAILSSVVPGVDAALIETLRLSVGLEPLVVGPGVKTGMPILYDNPHEVGADRIVNAVATLDRYGAPAVVIDFGTATTFDALDAEGRYVGGAIAPGLGLSAEALFQRAARLHRVDVQRPKQVIGRTTEESLRSGLFHGYAALIRGLLDRVVDELGGEPHIVATGGLASVFESELPRLEAVDHDLTLDGLRLIWEKNRR